MKSHNVNGDFSHISPSTKLNEYPWVNAFIAKKQSSAMDPSNPLLKETCFSAPICNNEIVSTILHNMIITKNINHIYNSYI